MESESTRVTEHVNAQVRAVQRAFGVLADTLEDEVGNMRAADAQQWEQLKVHATQFNEVEVLKAERERTRNDLRSTQSAFTAFKTDESAVVARKVEELAAMLKEKDEEFASFQQGTMVLAARARAAPAAGRPPAPAPPRPKRRSGRSAPDAAT